MLLALHAPRRAVDCWARFVEYAQEKGGTLR